MLLSICVHVGVAAPDPEKMPGLPVGEKANYYEMS